MNAKKNSTVAIGLVALLAIDPSLHSRRPIRSAVKPWLSG